MSHPNTSQQVLLRHGTYLIYSLVGVFLKKASFLPTFSPNFLLLYGTALLLLSLYALAWQQVLKRMPLNTAYAGKAITVVWGMIWGALLFGEKIRWTMLVGACLILVGILIVNEDKADES